LRGRWRGRGRGEATGPRGGREGGSKGVREIMDLLCSTDHSQEPKYTFSTHSITYDINYNNAIVMDQLFIIPCVFMHVD
jgi:hypothetical protein